MKIIILGAGQVGRTVAEIMATEENDITVVDCRTTLLQELQQRLDIRTVVGHASHPNVLYRAGIEDAELVFAVTNDDEINMIACQVAYSLYQTPTRLARVRSFEYTAHPNLFKPTAMPVDYVINPEQMVTRNLQALIQRPGALEAYDFADGKAQLVAARVIAGAPMAGQELGSLGDWAGQLPVLVVAVFRRSHFVPPRPGLVLEPTDEVYFMAAPKDVQPVLAALHPARRTNRRIIIAGGGNLGLRLAEIIEPDYHVRLIERDPVRCRYLAGSLRRTIVLNGDATDSELLGAEGIEDTDVFCATTNADKTNIVSAMLAKQLGARQTLAIVNNASQAVLSEQAAIDIAISPAQVTIGALLTHIRRGDVVKVHSLRHGSAEAMELVVHGDRTTSHVVGRRIGDLPLDEGVSICAVLRQGRLQLADADTVIETGDRVVLFLSDKQQIPDVELLFQVAITYV